MPSERQLSRLSSKQRPSRRCPAAAADNHDRSSLSGCSTASTIAAGASRAHKGKHTIFAHCSDKQMLPVKRRTTHRLISSHFKGARYTVRPANHDCHQQCSHRTLEAVRRTHFRMRRTSLKATLIGDGDAARRRQDQPRSSRLSAAAQACGVAMYHGDLRSLRRP